MTIDYIIIFTVNLYQYQVHSLYKKSIFMKKVHI